MKNKETKGILISIFGFIQGGAEIMPIRIANYLHKHHYKVGIHCLKKECDLEIRNLLHPDIPVYYTDRSLELAAIILVHRYGVIHSHCVSSQQLVARMKKRIPFLPLYHVATSHGGYEGMDMAEAVTVIKNTNRTVDMWTYVADNNLELFRLAGVAEQKLRKIGNAMEAPENIQPVNWGQYGIPEDAIVFCVITRAVWKKCWNECIEAIKRARELTGKNIHLALCGTGPVYETLIQQSQETFIHLVGEVTNPCAFYKASYCGLLLSVRECAPLGIIEMYHAGVPVIATDTGDVRQMMHYEDGQTGIVINLSEEGSVPVLEAAEAICKMVQQPAVYEKCKENAVKKAHEFSMEYVFEQYMNCYKGG